MIGGYKNIFLFSHIDKFNLSLVYGLYIWYSICVEIESSLLISTLNIINESESDILFVCFNISSHSSKSIEEILLYKGSFI